ncbi:MAG: PAS domain S-box protein [Methanolobus sp.]|nr:PAS domain S-box protein [Methanolobus sp.]
MKDESKSQKQSIEELQEMKVCPQASAMSCESFKIYQEKNSLKKNIFMEGLLRYIPDLVFCKDREGVYLECNPAFSELVGQSIENIIGRNDYDLFKTEVADYFQTTDKKVMEEENPIKLEEWVTYPDGRRAFLETIISPLKSSNGELFGIIGISRDITDRKYKENSLHMLRNELSQIVNGSLIPMFVIDRDHTVLYWNKACERITGIPAAEIINKREHWKAFYSEKRPLLADLVLDEQVKPIQKYYCDKGLKSSSFEGVYEARDYFPKMDKWLSFNVAPLRNTSGNIIGAIETIQDITATKKAEEELSKQHEQLLSILEGIDEPVYVSDPESYELLFVNSPLKEEYGDDIVGKKCYSVFQDRKSPCPFCTNDIIFKNNHGKTHVWEFQNNVNKRWYRCIDKAIEWPDGHLVRFEMAIDIHEHKMSEKALQESEERFEAISTFAQDAIIAINNKGNITFWNKAAERIFGYSREEVLDQDVHLLLASPAYYKIFKSAFSVFQETGEGPVVGKTLEMTAKNRNGVEFPIELSLSAVMLKNKWTAIAVIRDATERKKFEEALLQAKKAAENANRTKSEFLANMSHELRTPLNAIIGFSDVMLDGSAGDVNGRQYRYLNNISSSGKHLLGIINDILDLSKVESGKSQLEIEKVPVLDILGEMISFMQPLAANKEIVLKLGVNPDFSHMLADKAKLKQIIYNLLGNAIKFTDAGGYVIIKARSDGKFAYISVIDTGIGIAADDLEKLFKPFTQLDSSSSRQYEGTGLGLALARELVELHNGKIWVESEPGKGSNFTFILPLEREERIEKKIIS